MGRKWNLMGENGKGNGGYVNLPFLRKMKIFGFALGQKCNEAISHILSGAKSRILTPLEKTGKNLRKQKALQHCRAFFFYPRKPAETPRNSLESPNIPHLSHFVNGWEKFGFLVFSSSRKDEKIPGISRFLPSGNDEKPSEFPVYPSSRNDRNIL